MQALHAAIAARKAELDRLRRRAPHGAANFDHSQDLELTYTSNAIEGNTLTAIETTLVIEQGITIGGKPLRDHCEAIDHFEAIRYVRALARQARPVTEMDVRTLHRLVLLRSMPHVAGQYADQGRFVLTARGRRTCCCSAPATRPCRCGPRTAPPTSPPCRRTQRRPTACRHSTGCCMNGWMQLWTNTSAR